MRSTRCWLLQSSNIRYHCCFKTDNFHILLNLLQRMLAVLILQTSKRRWSWRSHGMCLIYFFNFLTLAFYFYHSQVLKRCLSCLDRKLSIIPETHLSNIINLVAVSIGFLHAFMQYFHLRSVDTVEGSYHFYARCVVSQWMELWNIEVPHLFAVMPEPLFTKNPFQLFKANMRLMEEVDSCLIVRCIAWRHHKVYSSSNCF